MEELCELRRYIEMGDTAAALALLDEMDEMSKDDKIQKIASFMRVLLVHMIKAGCGTSDYEIVGSVDTTRAQADCRCEYKA